MTPELLSQAASALWEAARSHEYIPPLRDTYPWIGVESAYAIQKLNTERRLSEGRRLVGCKIGLTSAAVQQQLGVDQPDYGMLFDDMSYGDSEPIPVARVTQPRIESEVAFVMGRDLLVPNPGHVDVMNAVAYALPALEIVGSRIKNWDIRIADTIADNASSSAFVLGNRPCRLSDIDLRLCGMVMERRGEPISVGAGAACLGHPLNAVVWLARKMCSLNTPLRAGDIVLSGALGPMASVQPGDVVETRISGLGAVRAVFESAPGRER